MKSSTLHVVFTKTNEAVHSQPQRANDNIRRGIECCGVQRCLMKILEQMKNLVLACYGMLRLRGGRGAGADSEQRKLRWPEILRDLYVCWYIFL